MISGSRDAPLDFCWHQHFLPQICKFCYIKTYKYRLCFNTYLVFKDCLNKHGSNFGDVCKNGYSRPSKNKGILK